jgi:hypothetical protein
MVDLLSKSDGLSAIAIGGFIDAYKKQIIESIIIVLLNTVNTNGKLYGNG